MSKDEYNRDIRRVLKMHQNKTASSNIIKTEIKRLYCADTNFIQSTKKTFLILMRLNLLYRVIELHFFGLQIDLDKL